MTGTGLAHTRRDTDQLGFNQREEVRTISQIRTASKKEDGEDWERDELRCHLGDVLTRTEKRMGSCLEDPNHRIHKARERCTVI